MAVDPDAVLARVNGLHHEITLLQLGLRELNERLESVLALSKVDLARFEDLIRQENRVREGYKDAEFAGEQEEGDDLVGP